VRHTHEPDHDRETLVQSQAEELLQRGAAVLGDPNVERHVVTDRSTPEGLRALAEREGASVIVFCSDSHTAKGHVSVGNSAERLLDGARASVAIAPAGFAESTRAAAIQRIVAVGDGDGGAHATAESLARALNATVEPVADDHADLLVIDSRPEAEPGRISLSSSAAHLIEIATCPVLVVPRGAVLQFEHRHAAVGV
jgi:nucleotide-binding universal stress UspA family protein